MMKYVAFALNAVAFLFILVCLGGANGDVAWSKMTRQINNCDTTINAGLLGVKKWDSCTKGVATTILYDSDSCTSNQIFGSACGNCDSSGKGVLSMTVFAFLLTLVILGLQGTRFVGKSWDKMIMATLCFVNSFLFFLMWTIWVGGCNKKIKDTGDEWDKDVDAAWALSFLGFLLTAGSGVLELLCMPSGGEGVDYTQPYAQQNDNKSDV
mmetsp:Transcript_34837/g.67740  ORF Transcript_34837/g.67740 Transcript_34837/m.67740 type:complete len:210 (+) Transcript_34837:74-703(+)